jgi:NADH dehydrogenase
MRVRRIRRREQEALRTGDAADRRSGMATRRVATVFGGSGFIGRYVVKRLAQQGYVVRVAVRDPEAALFLKPMGAVGQVVPLYASVTNEPTVHRAVEGAEVVVNLVGLLAESPAASFQAVHAEGAARIARIAAATGVSRLIQISAIGADPDSPSRYASTKGRAEQAVLAAFPRATILRPSLVFGLEDKFFNRFAEIARLSPIMPVISGDTKMQPVFVADVADAVMAALVSSASCGKIYELGGPRVWTFREILAFILKQTRRNRKLVDMQHVPGKPLTPDQLLLLSKDNIVSPGALGLADLGINATPVELVVPDYLSRYQPGGGRRPTIPQPQ